MHKTHKIAIRRKELGLSVADVAILSGVAQGTISSIERGGRIYKINFATAKALAYGLDAPVHTLFDESELSDLGRPALTGTKIGRRTRPRTGTVCIQCHLEVPRGSSNCPDCNAA